MTHIATKAMLVDLRVSQWTARKIDRKATSEVAANHQLAQNQGTYYKSLIDGSALETVQKVVRSARDYHYRCTLPWSDAGPRALSSMGYFDYMQRIGEFKTEFDNAVAQLLGDYPLHRQEAKRLLGTLFNEDDYPTADVLAGKFDFRLNVLPLPCAGDFRVEIGEDELARVQAEIERTTTATLTSAVGDAYQRVAKVLEAFIDRLAKPETVFRDSLVENARDLAEVLPSLNLTADPQLDVIAKRLSQHLCQHEPDRLRTDPHARKAAFNEACAMHKDVLAFFTGALA
jgi:hypothetical protein